MRTYISVPNEKAEQFEQTLEEFEFFNNNIRERDFMTDFIFEDLNEVEEAVLECIKSDLI